MMNIALVAALYSLCFCSSVFSTTASESAPSICKELSAEELRFAASLSESNRTLFCSTFTDVQRAAAMQLTSQPTPTGALITPNEAVEKVAYANNLLTHPPSAKGCQPSRGVLL